MNHKNKIFVVGIIEPGYISSVAERMGMDASDIIVVENQKDIPIDAKIPPKRKLPIYDLPIVEKSDFFEVRKKKPKNKNWQMRMEELQRRT